MPDRRPAPRLLLLTHSYAPETTPPARRWSAIVAELRRAGWEVAVLAPESGDRRRGRCLGEHGEHVLSTRARRQTAAGRNGRFADAVLHALQCIPRGLAVPRPGVVVVTVPALPSVVPARVLALLRRLPLVVEMRDAWPDLAKDAGLRTGPLGKVMEAVVGGTQSAADLVVTVTEGFARMLASRGVKRVETLANGVRLGTLPELPPRRRDDGELHVLYLGNHGESQGLERLVEAAARLRTEAPGVHVRLVGDGTRREELTAHNARLGHPAEMLPAAHGDEARRHYEWADTVVVALRPDWASFLHTVPSKTYELLSIGRHVTAQVAGEGAAIVEQAHAGTVVGPTADDLVDHLAALAEDPASTTPDPRARRWVERHADLAAIGRRYSALLESLLRR